ncbi:bifunctional dihydropteridine reductase/dihydrofolate reductase TmpR [Oscillatoriales cyanobacterium LEGE 11467]|uniref:Bifunctional dihydropteridine reductase/dihydrofolate reductase TmpR n=1 Tax=Zarconia navalis LEGE 11467 TaxID=1828826 RepID=A0A928Z954_9CYAN|nr:bifunctional dihydropteridine reductase/dihydrofolate reductase TmpR [Zarconia navalis]MBE9040451.1 bifunctional dihydropteridine reductase/dihydrofolate reductase TmpR [Zarconia navalis LEGE 11467]
MVKKALVTGSAKGLGRAIALDLASKGFDIAVHYNRSEDAANEACQEAQTYGVKAIALQADITNGDRAKSLVENAVDGLGGLSVLVNTVGNYSEEENVTSTVSIRDWHEMINSNLNTTFYVTRSAIPHLKKAGNGRIINFACASAQNLIARRVNTPYIIAKTGIIIYTKSLAKELIQERITANIISPGIAENSFDVEEISETLPLKRPATLQEIARAVWFFVNPEAEYITGQVLEVSGGWFL